MNFIKDESVNIQSVKGSQNSETNIKTKVESIIQEFVEFTEGLRICLSNLTIFRNELMEEFKEQKEIVMRLENVFREIEPMELLYKIVIIKINLNKNKSHFCLSEVFLDREIRMSLILHKSFLSQYANNSKWIGQFVKLDKLCQDACDRAMSNMNSKIPLSLEGCLYTIFNSLFAFELMFDRYSKCFDANDSCRRKAEKAKLVIHDVLKDSSNMENEEQFFKTQKELNLLSGRKSIPKVNTEFITKDLVVKYSKSESRELIRQLVLFTDGLYIASIPENDNKGEEANAKVILELSFKSMAISVIPRLKENNKINKWGLKIITKGANKEIFFNDKEKMLSWKSKLDSIIQRKSEEEMPNNAVSFENLGEIAPEWQRDSLADFCNGFNCVNRFSSTVRRHHCRADGLLYCSSCTSYKIKLSFLTETPQRVCDLCYTILSPDNNNNATLELAKKYLYTVFQRKTRKGVKLNWLDVRVYNKESQSFKFGHTFFCELDSSHPFIRLYKKLEDKTIQREIMLMEMKIRTGDESKFCKILRPNQFTIENENKSEAYIFKTSSRISCNEWVKCITESISSYCEKK